MPVASNCPYIYQPSRTEVDIETFARESGDKDLLCKKHLLAGSLPFIAEAFIALCAAATALSTIRQSVLLVLAEIEFR